MAPQAEQPLLQGQAITAIGDVEERLEQELAVPVDDPDATGALDDEEAVATVIRRGDVDGIGQPLGDLDELDLRLARQRPPGEQPGPTAGTRDPRAPHRPSEWLPRRGAARCRR